MGTSLVIVESPAKAKTINKYLGKAYKVKSSIGHIRDLPTGAGSSSSTPAERAKEAAKTRKMDPAKRAKYKEARAKKALITRMGVDPEQDWDATYQVLPGKEKVLKELQDLAAKADMVYLATDLDREGEAIAWHLRELLGGDDDRFRRVTFSEITKKAIQEAFEQPAGINMDRVHAQQARRFLDRVVGFMVSPLLWKKVARSLSAGRVQSVAVRLVVEREREIRAFVPEEYWDLHADLHKGKEQLRAEVVKCQGAPFKPTSQADIDVALAALEGASYVVGERKDKPSSSKPHAPFITSTLQQAASVRLGFSVKKTMTLAQRLYEAGLITYMRTDATALSNDAIASCREFIGKTYGDDYLPEQPRIYSSAAGAQEAHEAIRPTDVRLEPEDAENRLEKDQLRLYDLIWRQFVACQMPSATFDTTTVTIQSGDYELRARGRVLRFAGWMKVLPPVRRKGDADVVLPDLTVGDALQLDKLDPAQHFTKPPARFSEASLVKELEKKGIGRPSTYAAIISTIQDRGYVKLDNKRLYAEKMGEIVTDRLVECFTGFMDYGFTASLEEELDKVASGDVDWREVLDGFYDAFTKRLQHADESMRGNEPVEVDIDCPACGRHMAIRNASTGVFLSCTGYTLSKKEGKCTQTINLVPGEESEIVHDDDEVEVEELRAKRRCPICSAAMDSWLIDEQRRLHVCGNNPDCPGYELETGSFKIKGYDGPILECDKCGADMELRNGRFGKYFACTECKNTRKLLRNGEPAPPKIDPIPFPELPCAKAPEDHYVLRDGAAGIFLAAASYPRVRDTRNPLVRELKAHADELPEKYVFLAQAPEADPDGNPAVVRFARKSKEHYVASEKDGKPTKWSAHYVDGSWQVSEQTPARAKAKKTKAKAKK